MEGSYPGWMSVNEQCSEGISVGTCIVSLRVIDIYIMHKLGKHRYGRVFYPVWKCQILEGLGLIHEEE